MARVHAVTAVIMTRARAQAIRTQTPRHTRNWDRARVPGSSQKLTAEGGSDRWVLMPGKTGLKISPVHGQIDKGKGG